MPDIDAERAAVVAEARAWLRTPYHHMGRVKGAGVDCATLLAEVYARAGFIPSLDLPFYPPDWHLHRDAERYLGFVHDYAVEIFPRVAQASRDSSRAPSCEAKRTKGVPDSGASCATWAQPGDIALWRFGRCFSHGAIVIDWPLVIHAYSGRGCVLEDAAKAMWLAYLGDTRRAQRRPVRFFTLKRWVGE